MSNHDNQPGTHGGSHWSYSGDTGPANWASLDPRFAACNAQRQSPVNIDRKQTTPSANLKSFYFEGYDKPSTNFFLTNNGHTAMLSQSSSSPTIRVYGGGLEDKFQFLQLHFHWGSESGRGSEHLIDGQSYPLELHLVHYNTKYGNASAAGDKGDGLAVLGVIFQVGEHNQHYAPITDSLKSIAQQNDEGGVRLKSPLTLSKLLPSDTSKYFRYMGSLTTPPCSETVVWTVFSEPVTISEQQLNQFRLLKSDHNHEISDNFRPPQPLYGRTILSSMSTGCKPENMHGSPKLKLFKDFGV